jgi:GNAT superfamily N-acetyltransferase
MKVSPAEITDVPLLCELLNELFMQEAEFEPDYAAQFRGLSYIIEQPEIGCILVARQDRQILGMVNLLYTISTALGARVAIMEDLVVTSSCRNKGIGSLLINAAIKHAGQHHCKRITLLTDQHNHAAQRFYVRHGFKVSAMQPLRLDLSGQDG